ncbi:hypothetical protein BJF83_07380 [Nocardiopsis sp. CNR-923]|uniref:hypothetical protein n=1 Tax=Nocardiopsis sp. CNR-923 TaxID=1904965 RepID=UPI00096681F9|nr:hypothetical protein [Nocardiopsis sp. CNR-923]OLT24277.1 hypothetical protein BJF83_07380 [Nocardiopsis sp. CNR-923]
MKRFSTVSGLVLATGLAVGSMTGTAAADNNANIQNITVPICADVLQFALVSLDGCNVIDFDANNNIDNR